MGLNGLLGSNDGFSSNFGGVAAAGVWMNSKIKSSVARSNIPHNIEAEEIKIFRNPQLAVGIDIGNANTCVTIYKEGE